MKLLGLPKPVTSRNAIAAGVIGFLVMIAER